MDRTRNPANEPSAQTQNQKAKRPEKGQTQRTIENQMDTFRGPVERRLPRAMT
jgi:hypothetical protein